MVRQRRKALRHYALTMTGLKLMINAVNSGLSDGCFYGIPDVFASYPTH